MDYRLFLRLFLSFIVMSAMILETRRASSVSASEPTSIRIGWQTTWATQGQITQTLKQTNALEKHSLRGNFIGVSYGAPLNEAALAGEVDVIFTADQPAAALLARSPDWVIIGRLMFNRVAIYVPPDSPIKMVAALKGKTIAMPFGAAAQRIAFKAIADAGLEVQTEIEAINLDITEQTGIIQQGTSSSWGEIDALAGFDPMVAILETNNTARMLHLGTVTSVIVMSKPYISTHPEAPVQFLKAFHEAVFYYAHHVERANDWFLQASQLTFSHDVLALAASVEPNLKAKTIKDVSITFTPALIAGMQEAANFIFEQGLIRKQLNMANHIDQRYAEIAYHALVSSPYKPASIYVLEAKK